MKKKLCLLFSIFTIAAIGLAACGKSEAPTAKRYSVTFSQEGADDVVLWIEHGQTIDPTAIPALPTADTGYEYVWSRNPSAPVTGNIAITAVLKAKTYTVTFDLDGEGSMKETTMSVTYGEEYTLPRPSDGRLSEFQYWKDEDGERVDATGTWAIASDVTLTAFWVFWTPNV